MIECGTFYSAKMKRTDLKVRNCGRVLILTRSSESITAATEYPEGIADLKN